MTRMRLKNYLKNRKVLKKDKFSSLTLNLITTTIQILKTRLVLTIENAFQTTSLTL